jgi:DNA replication and repair protein RecF
MQKFRSYRDESFEFDPGVNIIVGPNASGKTNLLEALLVACTGGSFRAKDGEMIAHGAPWARIDIHGSSGSRIVKLMVQENGAIKKEFVIRDQKLSRLALQKTVPVVLFEPNHLLLLQGSPDLRRDYLDNLLEQTVPGYGKARRDYRRALAQRNALLKTGPASKKQLFAWNIRLSEIGAKLALERHALVGRINNQIGELYKNLAHSKAAEVSVRYVASCDITQYGSSLLHGLEKRTHVDIERGFTTIGPHREDLLISFDGRDASDVASRGETRTVLLVLKIMELRFVEEARGTKPQLLLDDVFSELDGARRKALTEVIQGYQTFITTTDADVVVQHFMNNCHIIPLSK